MALRAARAGGVRVVRRARHCASPPTERTEAGRWRAPSRRSRSPRAPAVVKPRDIYVPDLYIDTLTVKAGSPLRGGFPNASLTCYASCILVGLRATFRMKASPTRPAAQSPRFFVWYSDDRSVRDRTLSAFATAEIAVAMVLFPSGAYWLGIPWVILVTLFVAPLLLMRSTKSVNWGVKWLEDYWDRSFEDALLNPNRALWSVKFWLSILLALAVGMLTGLCWIKWAPSSSGSDMH